MKQAIILFTAIMIAVNVFSQPNSTTQKSTTMKFNAGIITEKIAATKIFYTEVLGFGVTFENEFYLLMHSPGHEAEISFLLPNHPSQQPVFHKAFKGEGMYLTIEVDDVDKMYKAVKAKKQTIALEIRDEPWGDRHFAIIDPNGIAIDIVKYSPVKNDQ